ncbi:MAG: outer membrane beta-barrel family protein, partial [Muribaculaceae bacterium]|nr:outer membrane beta-barrel family protein [Muribaculaceae bacterium]
NEVVVKAPKLTVSPGRFTFYPGDIIKDANNAMEVMKFVPMVRTGSDGISLLGTVPKILVNGKEPIMGSSGVINMLRLSDAARIKRVEIIVQPGVARQNEGPIINLILAPRIGSMGTADLTFTYSEALSSRLQAWYGGEWEKWQFSCDISLNQTKFKTSGESTYTEFDPSLPETVDRQPSMDKYSTYRTESTGYAVAATVGASVDLGHDNSLGGSLFLSSDYSQDERHSLVSIMPDASDLNTSSNSKRPFNPTWVIGRMNYDHKLDSLGSTLRASLSYQGSFKHNETSYTPLASMQGEKSATDINSIQMKSDWNKHINDRASIDVGIDAFYDNVKRQLRKSPDGSLSGELTLDDDLQQTQTQFDIFAGGEYRFSSLFSFSLGARGRWYRREIDQHVQRANRKFEDFYILPTASASFAFSPMHMVTLGYTSGVEQPEYYLTNPIIYWMSPEYYSTGNPDLKAINIHNLHLTYILLQKITLSAKGR